MTGLALAVLACLGSAPAASQTVTRVFTQLDSDKCRHTKGRAEEDRFTDDHVLAANLYMLDMLDDSGRISLPAVLQALLARGVHAVLVEGGGEVHRSFLDSGLVDRIELFVAPKVLAGGPGWVGGAPFPLALAPGFRVVGVRQVGDDLHVSLEP